jgi:ribonuclease HI
MYTLQFDGLFRGISRENNDKSKAGFLCYGWIILQDERVIARGHGAYARGRDATSNIAEYLALIEGLDALQDMGVIDEPVRIIGDAKGVIDQMQGLADVTSPLTLPLYRRAMRLARAFRLLKWEWTPRRLNHQADQLTRKAMRQVRRDDRSFWATIQAIELNDESITASRRFLPILDLRVYQVYRS